MYSYWRQYEDDATHMKVMVSAMWFVFSYFLHGHRSNKFTRFFEALHTAFCIYIMYQYFVRDFGKPEDVNVIPW